FRSFNFFIFNCTQISVGDENTLGYEITGEKNNGFTCNILSMWLAFEFIVLVSILVYFVVIPSIRISKNRKYVKVPGKVIDVVATSEGNEIYLVTFSFEYDNALIELGEYVNAEDVPVKGAKVNV